jgi:hypothetical protein
MRLSARPLSLLVLPALACGEATPPSGDGDTSGGIPADTDGRADDAATEAGDSTSAGPGAGTADGTGGSDDDDATSATPTYPMFDVGTWEPIDDCELLGMGDRGGSFSIIWIANSPQGTVSKIDTTTATEVARYRTGPGAPDPSRTSVNLDGDVAVTNRQGSVTKIAARVEDCIDADGDGQITTSQGPDDILEWGDDECVLWHHDTGFDPGVAGSQGGPRGTAWTGGVYDEELCETVDANLWVGWRNQPATSVTIRLLDGDDGTPLGEVVVDEWPANWGHGPYGGAADADGNFWGLGTLGSVFRIEAGTFDVQRWDNPQAHVMYGIALDANGDPWVAGWSGNLWRFDVGAQTWIDKGPTDGGPERMRGLAIDAQGSAWIAGNNPCGLVQYDTVGDAYVEHHIALPGCSEPVGVSIDVDGMVWVVDRGADRAYKVDPSDHSVQEVTGLVDPYTYSDMTGAGLDLVINPPG